MCRLPSVFDNYGLCRCRRIFRRKTFLSPDVGGHLPEILGYDKTLELIKKADEVYLDFGADKNVYGIDKNEEIRQISH